MKKRTKGSAKKEPSISPNPITNPMTKEPMMLTANVPQGNVVGNFSVIHKDSPYRKALPTAPPSMTTAQIFTCAEW